MFKTCEEYVLNEIENKNKEIEELKKEIFELKDELVSVNGTNLEILKKYDKLYKFIKCLGITRIEEGYNKDWWVVTKGSIIERNNSELDNVDFLKDFLPKEESNE